MYNMRVLEMLESGDISTEKAITMLSHPPKSKPLPKGHILMIRIRDAYVGGYTFRAKGHTGRL